MEKIVFTVKEATKKAGKKGPFWSVKDEKGLVYNAKIEDFGEINPGDILNTAFNTTEYEGANGKVKSRWLVKNAEGAVDPVDVAKKVFNVPTEVKPAISRDDKIVAAILSICEDTDGAVKKYKEILGKL